MSQHEKSNANGFSSTEADSIDIFHITAVSVATALAGEGTTAASLSAAAQYLPSASFLCEPHRLVVPPGRRTVFGGQLIALGLCAATSSLATEPGALFPHSTHANFVRAVDPTKKVFIDVWNVHKGRSFARCRVVLRQDLGVSVDMLVSLARTAAESNHFVHSVVMPLVKPPFRNLNTTSQCGNSANSNAQASQNTCINGDIQYYEKTDELEIVEEHLEELENKEAVARAGFWMRAPRASLRVSDPEHQYSKNGLESNSETPIKIENSTQHSARLQTIRNICYLTCMTDAMLLPTALSPHCFKKIDTSETQKHECGAAGAVWERQARVSVAASLDHSVWLHSLDFKADEWLLLDVTTTRGCGTRVFAKANVWTANGVLVATTAQEGFAIKEQ